MGYYHTPPNADLRACADAEDILMASRLESSSKSGLPITWITGFARIVEKDVSYYRA